MLPHPQKLIWVLAMLPIFAFGQNEDILDMSLEQLMGMEVTSVSKKAQRLQDVASAVHVVTSEDINFSGATTIVELLRELVPGFWAASLDFNRYDTYVRNSSNASFLVLLDGTPMNDLMYVTMQWNNFDIPLSAIDRIEIVRGSGGVIYGANSATGVISIFTKSGQEQSMLDIRAEGAWPLNGAINAVYNQQINEQLSIGAYGRYRYFEGYEQIPEIENESSIVPASYNEGDTVINSRFTEDDRTAQLISSGFRLNANLSERLQLSSALHFNASFTDMYNQVFPSDQSSLLLGANGLQIRAGDEVSLVSDNKHRLNGHLRGDWSFSERHQVFARVSFNREQDHLNVLGGARTRNSLIDFEVQDNFTIGFNNISFGANFRLLNYDVYEVAGEGLANFVDRQNSENLSGFFIQDNIELLDDRLNFYLGAKAENFSLINDRYYLSPMLKATASLTEALTLWGGFSRSFTTPGYTQTNIDLRLVRIPTPEGFTDLFPALASQLVAEESGLPDDQIPAFLASPAGQQAIADAIPGVQALIALQWPGSYQTGVVNGRDTEPTSFTNFEIGLRWQMMEGLFFESNFYHSLVRDEIINSPIALDTLPAPTNPVERVEAFFYGNYVDGSNTGVETAIKYQVTSNLYFEASHTFFLGKRSYKNNDDFVVSDLPERSQDALIDEEFPVVPKHIFRARMRYHLPAGLTLSSSGIFTTANYNRFGTINPFYQFDQQRFDPLFGDVGRRFLVGQNDNRVIINFKLIKELGDNFSVNLFGNDILSDPFIESVNQFDTVYPRQVGRMIGFGLQYNL